MASPSVAANGSPAVLQHATINQQVFATPGIFRYYLAETLEPVEAASLLRFQPRFAGKDVLDIGVGAGRTTRYLAPLAARYEAVDYSPEMLAYMRRVFPAVSSRLADFRDLSAFSDGSFDFVFATNNVLDNFSTEDRHRALREAHRVLRPGGMILLSSHNLRFAEALSGPRLEWTAHPVRLVRNVLTWVASVRNHARVGRLREVHDDHALLNDIAHRFSILHYYAPPETVIAQLQACGFALVSMFDKGGQIVAPGEDTSHSSSVTYAAERLP